MSNATNSEEAMPIRRSDRFVVSMQIEALCIALRLAVQTKDQPGVITTALLAKFRADVLEIIDGRCKQNIPATTEHMSAIDMLALAESLRGTIAAFLTPDESEDQRGSFGFRPN